jgi:hypothetical protein
MMALNILEASQPPLNIHYVKILQNVTDNVNYLLPNYCRDMNQQVQSKKRERALHNV